MPLMMFEGVDKGERLEKGECFMACLNVYDPSKVLKKRLPCNNKPIRVL